MTPFPAAPRRLSCGSHGSCVLVEEEGWGRERAAPRGARLWVLIKESDAHWPIMDVDKLIGLRLADKSAVGAINRPLRSGRSMLFMCIIGHNMVGGVCQF